MITVGVNTYAYAWTTPAAEAVGKLSALGYTAFELLLQPPHLPLDGFGIEARRGLAAALDAAGSTHRVLNLPSLDHNLVSPMERARRFALDMFRDTLDLAADLRCDTVVLVPGRLSPLAPASMALRSDWLRAGLDVLLPLAQARGLVLAMENVPMASFPRAAELGGFVRSVASPLLRVCYDVANAHFVGEDPVGAIAALGDLLHVIHVSDTTQQRWRHDPIGDGDVPFPAIPPALAAAGFKGPVMLEILATEPDAAIAQSHDRLAAAGFPARPAR